MAALTSTFTFRSFDASTGISALDTSPSAVTTASTPISFSRRILPFSGSGSVTPRILISSSNPLDKSTSEYKRTPFTAPSTSRPSGKVTSSDVKVRSSPSSIFSTSMDIVILESSVSTTSSID